MRFGRGWLRAAAILLAAALFRLGMLYHSGAGVERDAAEAARWRERADARN